MSKTAQVQLGDKAVLDAMVESLKKAEPPPIPDRPLAEVPKMVEQMKEVHPVRSEEETAKYWWENVIIPNLQASRIPVRFHFEIGGWIQPKQRKTFDLCRELCQGKGAIVALVGERGVGKTTIAGQIILDRAKDETREPWARRPPYRKMADLIAALKLIYSDFGGINSEHVTWNRDTFCKLHPLVIIDELHECEDQKLKDRILTDILDRRYSHLNDTILITNQTAAEFKATTNDSILSRLTEHGRIVECRWPSFREGKQAA